MLVPLYGFLEGDTIGLLVFAHDDMSIREVAERLRRSANVRVELSGDVEVFHDDTTLDPDLTVTEAGLEALDRFDVRRRESR